MKSTQIILLASVAIALLVGICTGLYIQVTEQSAIIDGLKTEISNELRQSPRAGKLPQHNAPENAPITQHWISNDYSDQKPYGFFVSVDMRTGGKIVLEKCAAPDTSNFHAGDELPTELTPVCRQLIQAGIEDVDGTGLVLGTGKKLPLELDAERRRMVLTTEDEVVVLAPGSKYVLIQELTTLPTILKAYREAIRVDSQNVQTSE